MSRKIPVVIEYTSQQRRTGRDQKVNFNVKMDELKKFLDEYNGWIVVAKTSSGNFIVSSPEDVRSKVSEIESIHLYYPVGGG